MVSRMYPLPESSRAETPAEAQGQKMPVVRRPRRAVTPRAAMDWPEIASAPTKGRVDVAVPGEPDGAKPMVSATDWPAVVARPAPVAPQSSRVLPPVARVEPLSTSAAQVTMPHSAVQQTTAIGTAVIDPPSLESLLHGAGTSDIGPVSVDDLSLEAMPSRLSPRFRFEPVAEFTNRKASKKGRLAQGAMLLGLIAAVGAFIVMLPDDDTSIDSSEPARVETVGKPVATADMADSAEKPEIEGSLGDTGGFGNLMAFAAPTPGSPADNGAGFDAAVAGVIEEAAPKRATTTTTTWAEPTIPPQSEWVDAGNGFLVPDIALRIRFCESTNNYRAANPSSTARGAYQFLNGSWDWYGHAARTGVSEAHLATPAEQDEAALLTLQKQGTTPWLASRGCWADPNIDPRYAIATPPKPVTTTTVAEAETSTTTAVDDSSSTTTASSISETTVPDSSTSSTETTDSSTSSTTQAGSSSTTTPTTIASTTTPPGS